MPVAELSPNSRNKWAKIKATTAARYAAQEEARSARFRWCHEQAELRQWVPLKEPVTASVTFILKKRTRRDLDNMIASLKPTWDGFKDGGLLLDDNCWVLKLRFDAEYEPVLGPRKDGKRESNPQPARVRIVLEGAP